MITEEKIREIANRHVSSVIASNTNAAKFILENMIREAIMLERQIKPSAVHHINCVCEDCRAERLDRA